MLTYRTLFCGAGGDAAGAEQVEGLELVHAMNHWQKAIDVHAANHPRADHDCADISQYEPRRLPATDILWASPECTNHSQAKGRKHTDVGQPDIFGETLPDEAAERSRATMWDVPRFTEAHGYEAIIVENVVDAAKWAPFTAWLMAMDSYGYDHQIVCLNSMHAQAGGLPAPQSRDRMYVVFWKKGNRRPDLEHMQRPRAYCPSCDQIVEALQSWKKPGNNVGRYRSQYVYRCPKHTCRGQIVEPGWLPAAAAIDWSLPGTRIGDRDKDLADKTRRRIAAGIARYWHPIHLEAGGHTYDAADPKHLNYDDPNGYYRAWSTYDVLKTLHTIESKALAIPVEGRDGKEARPMGDPLRTLTTRAETAMVAPFIAELRGGGSTARSVEDPAATFTAAGNHHGLVTPYYGASQSARPTSDAIGALTTIDRYALVMRNNGGGAEMSTPASEVLRTLTTTGHQSVLTPGDLAAAEAQVDDCLFRMLEPHEVAAGMAFPGDYIWEGTRRERVRMAGNAVTPPAARDLLACVTESLS
jgi:DNA (cytosine-5)-methyltransferase 1